jgi:hypothetical protein
MLLDMTTLNVCQGKCKTFQQQTSLLFILLNSLTAKSVLAGEKLVLFGKYVLDFYVGTVLYILCETKTWCAKTYLLTQCTNWRILTSAKKIQF